MSELNFIVEAEDDALTARAVGESIFTQGEDAVELRAMVRDAVRCHFDEGEMPRMIRLTGALNETLTLDD